VSTPGSSNHGSPSQTIHSQGDYFHSVSKTPAEKVRKVPTKDDNVEGSVRMRMSVGGLLKRWRPFKARYMVLKTDTRTILYWKSKEHKDLGMSKCLENVVGGLLVNNGKGDSIEIFYADGKASLIIRPLAKSVKESKVFEDTSPQNKRVSRSLGMSKSASYSHFNRHTTTQDKPEIDMWLDALEVVQKSLPKVFELSPSNIRDCDDVEEDDSDKENPEPSNKEPPRRRFSSVDDCGQKPDRSLFQVQQQPKQRPHRLPPRSLSEPAKNSNSRPPPPLPPARARGGELRMQSQPDGTTFAEGPGGNMIILHGDNTIGKIRSAFSKEHMRVSREDRDVGLMKRDSFSSMAR